MRILVTGADGLIGSHCYKRCIEEGHRVYGTDLNGDGLHHLDLLDAERVAKYVDRVKPDLVYHFAANAAEGKAQFSPIDITKRNIEIFLNVIVPCINSGMKRFVFTSSIAVYGEMQIPFKESDPPMPQDIYGINKLAIEQIIRVLSNVHGFEYVITRPHNVYGPGQNMRDPYRNVVTIFMNHLLKGEPYSIYGDGSMGRCFSYIDDVIDVIYRSGVEDVAGLTINVGSEKIYTINQLSEAIQMVSGKNIKPKYLPERPQEVHTAKSDHSICKKVLGYKDTPLVDGLRETWNWCREQGYQEPEYTEIEIHNPVKLPENWRVED